MDTVDKEGVVLRRLEALGVSTATLAGELAVPSGGCAVFYMSAFDGFGNDYSDVDTYVVWPSAGSPTARPERSVTVPVGQSELDIEYWPEGHLREALALGTAEGSILGPDIFTLKGFYELKVLYRIVTGVCLVGRDYWGVLRERVKADSFCRGLAEMYHRLYQDIFDDAAKLYDAADYESAILLGQNLLRAAAGVALARRNVPVFKEKWLYRGLARVYGPEHPLAARFWALLTRVEPTGMAAHAAEMLDFGNLLVNEADE